MKKMKALFKTALMLVLVLTLTSGKDPCAGDELYNQALSMLKDYSLIKDYRVSLKKKKKNGPEEFMYFPITLNRNQKYRFYGVSSPLLKGKLVITIYNNMKRDFQVATTYNKATQTARESIEFQCSTTGNFCIGISFLNGEEGCGVGIASFMKS